ncbi:MAG: hypothetical protein ACK5EA_22380 [Planctomycetaceae bacterium]
MDEVTLTSLSGTGRPAVNQADGLDELSSPVVAPSKSKRKIQVLTMRGHEMDHSEVYGRRSTQSPPGRLVTREGE